ncbi:MAG: LacI family DNA-binding transcriptional regulator [Gemmatimonadaceae bacterium]
MRSVTLRDVAKRCAVSTATVSAVVNGAEWVSRATRTRVQQAVDGMGYRPNQLARGLKTRRGYAVGVIVSDLTNPFFTEIVRSMSQALREKGHALFLCDSDHCFDIGDSNLRMLLDGHISGLVLVGDSVPEESLRRHARRRGEGGRLPVIAIEREYGVDGISSLLVDSRRGAYVMTQHLLGCGHRRIAMIGGPSEGPGSSTYGRAQRLAGYQEALSDAGPERASPCVVEGNFRYGGGRDAMARLLALPERPDAVFAANDMMALGAMDAVRQAGLRVPGDVALAGYDDVPTASLTTPGLTTMAVPKREIGIAAAELLGRQIMQPGRYRAVRRTFDAELVVRESCAVAAPLPA